MKKALIVGIDHYSSEIPNLDHCINTAESVHGLLATNEPMSNGHPQPNFDCKTLCSNGLNDKKSITLKNFKRHIAALFEDEESDVALLYFSGYAYEDYLGTYLLTEGVTDFEEGLALTEIMVYANKSSIKEINIILDLQFISQDHQYNDCLLYTSPSPRDA